MRCELLRQHDHHAVPAHSKGAGRQTLGVSNHRGAGAEPFRRTRPIVLAEFFGRAQRVIQQTIMA